ncbi:MAG: hypothetical protein L0L47_03385 [Bifidobacterium mongoliense]|nr:hypothetical protein [Bifidobacterium mongoliense]
MQTSNDTIRSTDFQTIPGFGPQLDGGLTHSFAIPVGIGDLTAMATPGLAGASRVAMFIPGFSGVERGLPELFPAAVRQAR